MSDKALITDAELELTQKMQMHFPRGGVSAKMLHFWNGCPKEVLSAHLAETLNKIPESVSEQPELLLESLGTVTIPATTSKFIAKDRFVVNTSDDAPVKISGIGSNFTEWFLNGEEKIEEPASEQTLRYAKLRQSSVDGPIIAELGGEAKAEITPSAMFSLMEKQKSGGEGVLLNNGYANIFYIRYQNNALRAVSMYWFGDGWRVFADSVERPDGWRDSRRVFSSLPAEAVSAQAGNS